MSIQLIVKNSFVHMLEGTKQGYVIFSVILFLVMSIPLLLWATSATYATEVSGVICENKPDIYRFTE